LTVVLDNLLIQILDYEKVSVQVMERAERGWDEFWAECFRVRYRRSIPGINEYDRMLVEFCIDTLNLNPEQEILDIACGGGDHCIEFAKRNLKVTGFDISKNLIRTANELARKEGVSVELFTGDMREIEFINKFHAAVLLSHSFGFFNHEENILVLKGSFDALVNDGKLLLDLMNPYNLPNFQKTWTALEGGYLLSEPHVLDASAGVLRGRPAVFIDVEGENLILPNEDALVNNDIRMYTAQEIKTMLEEIGFVKIEFYGQNKLPRMPYAARSERMVVVATKP
jgi:2-polyprenyl-3-methyl-5-hydroxy-6-metoxy-1,4-benzoquinol methylase